MDENRFLSLLKGQKPTADEFIQFIMIIKELDYGSLWNINTSSPKMNWILRAQLSNELRSKIIKKNTNDSIKSIVNKYTWIREQRFKQLIDGN